MQEGANSPTKPKQILFIEDYKNLAQKAEYFIPRFVANFIHLMVLFYTIIVNRTSKRIFVVLLCCIFPKFSEIDIASMQEGANSPTTPKRILFAEDCQGLA